MESDQDYIPIAKFFSDVGADTHSDGLNNIWVFWSQQPSSPEIANSAIRNKFQTVLNKLVSLPWDHLKFLAQFWVPKEMDGEFYLTTADQPFAVGNSLSKGLRSYRQQCVVHNYSVGEGAKEEEVGPIGRVFRNGHPECSPDLRLYSTEEYSLRDVAARSTLTAYFVLPLFGPHGKKCGVLEFLARSKPEFASSESESLASRVRLRDVDRLLGGLKAAGLTSTRKDYSHPYKSPLLTEIQEMVELAGDVVPQIHLAQVWVPCKQCPSTSNNRCCMERAAIKINANCSNFERIAEFCDASAWQCVQIEKGIAGIVLSSSNESCFCRNICDLSMSKYPLAHYARLAGLSFVFATFLQGLNDVDDDVYVVEFFLQSHSRVDAYPSSILKLLLQIMKNKLKSVKVASSGQLGEEWIVEVRAQSMLASSELAEINTSPLGYKFITHVTEEEHQSSKEFTMISWMDGYHKIISATVLEKCLNQDDSLELCWLYDNMVIVYPGGKRQELELSPSAPIQEKIKLLLMEITSKMCQVFSYLVQFWAVKSIENKSCLVTSDQPFALDLPCKGLCEYRKRCIDHHYSVNEGAREDEVGPPGRVFLTNSPESTLDVRLYSTKEFPLHDCAVHCGLRDYLALPILYQDSCVGVLEFTTVFRGNLLQGPDVIEVFSEALKVANLKSTHTVVQPPRFNVAHRQSVLNDIRGMLNLVVTCPQLFLAKVWVPCYQCPHFSNNWICIDIRTSTTEFRKMCKLREGKSGERGIFRLLLASENKSCFCRDLCDFSITEEPHAVLAREARLDVYFALCLQGSRAGNELYILEFFLDPGCRNHEHLCSFLHFLLPIMKKKLKRLRVASGKQIGGELVVDVITFGKNNEFTSFESHLPHEFPIRFEIIQYDLEKEDQHGENNAACAGLDFSENATSVEKENISTGSSEKGISRERSKTSFCLSREQIEAHFGRNLSVAAKGLGVSRSTLKRACRDLGIQRWPSHIQNKENPRLFEESKANKRVRASKEQIQISTSRTAPPSDLSVHQNVPLRNIESIEPLTEFMQADIVTVKAEYNGDIIKFSFSISAGVNKLVEEVGSRFNLKTESIKLKYLDEDDDLILLGRDADVKLCFEDMKKLGKHYIKLLVQRIS